MKDATIIGFGEKTQRSTFIFSLEYDSTVSVLNSVNFLSNSASNRNVKGFFFPNNDHLICEGIENVDHLKAESLAAIYGLAFIERN